jgi:hypothetical protein
MKCQGTLARLIPTCLTVTGPGRQAGIAIEGKENKIDVSDGIKHEYPLKSSEKYYRCGNEDSVIPG